MAKKTKTAETEGAPTTTQPVKLMNEQNLQIEQALNEARADTLSVLMSTPNPTNNFTNAIFFLGTKDGKTLNLSTLYRHLPSSELINVLQMFKLNKDYNVTFATPYIVSRKYSLDERPLTSPVLRGKV